MSRPEGTSRPEGVRVQKVLSEAGVTSRRAAEQLIREGRVVVNNTKAVLGQRINPERDKVLVDGRLVQVDPTRTYLMLNKPPGVISTAKDPEGRRTVLDIVGAPARVFPVGRLDAATEGLLLLTDDGELTHRLTHPSFEVSKIYVAEVEGWVRPAAVRRLLGGVDIEAGKSVRADKVKVLDARKGPDARSVLEMTLHEGPRRVVRRMLEAVGHPVLRLVRTGVGPLHLGRLSTGTYRNLTPEEVASLYREVGL
ncbi:MAG: rRNA pseudouridine synthase [Actinomycetota bacterium]|nr:rRNA pseudouridine synthase [Actinomycetota bacterium]